MVIQQQVLENHHWVRQKERERVCERGEWNAWRKAEEGQMRGVRPKTRDEREGKQDSEEKCDKRNMRREREEGKEFNNRGDEW